MKDRRIEMFTVNALPGSYHGVVAYDPRTGKISVADDGRSRLWGLQTAIDALRNKPRRTTT